MLITTLSRELNQPLNLLNAYGHQVYLQQLFEGLKLKGLLDSPSLIIRGDLNLILKKWDLRKRMIQFQSFLILLQRLCLTGCGTQYA